MKSITLKCHFQILHGCQHMCMHTYVDMNRDMCQTSQHIMTPSNISHKHRHFHLYSHAHSFHSCHKLRVGDPYCAISVLQINIMIYSILLFGSSNLDFCKKHWVVTFYGFIPHQQLCHEPEMTPLCYSVQRSASFLLTLCHSTEEDKRFLMSQM